MLIFATAVFASGSGGPTRERLKTETEFKIYAVIFGVTPTADSKVPKVRFAKVIDPKSGTTDPVKVDVPKAFIDAAKEKIEAKRYEPKVKDGKPEEVFTYFYFSPEHPAVVIVDLDMPLDKQP